ncbi:MAG TPA: CehA/McbA family metallohydrolase [Thermoanaerobaculia bacterium]|nr:CehA/McbA family metallohydrolase [Thermoanaerobaculia bacterium]
MHAVLLALVLQLSGVETVTTAADHYDKYASVAFDREATMWIAYASMHGDETSIVVRSKAGGRWSGEERLDRGEGFEGNPKLIVDGRGNLWAIWHGRRHDRWSIFARRHVRGTWQAEQRISPADENALHPVAAVDLRGRIWIAYEVAKPGGFAVEVMNPGTKPKRISSGGSDRRPAIAASPDGSVWIAWDSTRSGNYDIYLANSAKLDQPVQVTRDGTVDDTPSIACARDGSLWIAWNAMRGHKDAPYRTDRHGGDAFVRVYRDGEFLAPPNGGQVSFGAVNKTPRDAVDPYWHWRQTQNYPVVFVDKDDRAWVIWRTDATGAHNFDLWARVFDSGRVSSELHLTDFSPGRDEFPSLAVGPDGLHMAWEAQALPAPGDEAKFGGGDVDLYNTLGIHNVILTAVLPVPAAGTAAAPLEQVSEVFRESDVNEPMFPGPPPRTATTTDGKYHIYFGDPHSHTILSDAKTGWPDQLLELERDREGLDFGVVSDHAEMGKLQTSEFAEVQLTAEAFSEGGRFMSLSGWEWTAGPAFGHRVIIFRGNPVLPLSAAAPEGDSIEKLYAHVRGHDAVMSPHHTGHATWGRWNPDAPHDETLEPNFEIASWHGRNEYYGNPHEGRRQVPGHQYQDALRRGRHVGVMAASDTHHLSPGEGGITAVLAERLDRESIFNAIRNRRNYATTGPRIVLEFTAAGAPMGSRITHSGPLEMKVRVEGTAAIDHVEIVRNLIDTFAAIRIEQNPNGPDGVYMLYDAADPQGGNRLASSDTTKLTFTMRDINVPSGEVSYYVRVMQADGNQAWSSPIWVTK